MSNLFSITYLNHFPFKKSNILAGMVGYIYICHTKFEELMMNDKSYCSFAKKKKKKMFWSAN